MRCLFRSIVMSITAIIEFVAFVRAKDWSCDEDEEHVCCTSEEYYTNGDRDNCFRCKLMSFIHKSNKDSNLIRTQDRGNFKDAGTTLKNEAVAAKNST